MFLRCIKKPFPEVTHSPHVTDAFMNSYSLQVSCKLSNMNESMTFLVDACIIFLYSNYIYRNWVWHMAFKSGTPHVKISSIITTHTSMLEDTSCSFPKLYDAGERLTSSLHLHLHERFWNRFSNNMLQVGTGNQHHRSCPLQYNAE